MDHRNDTDLHPVAATKDKTCPGASSATVAASVSTAASAGNGGVSGGPSGGVGGAPAPAAAEDNNPPCGEDTVLGQSVRRRAGTGREGRRNSRRIGDKAFAHSDGTKSVNTEELVAAIKAGHGGAVRKLSFSTPNADMACVALTLVMAALREVKGTLYSPRIMSNDADQREWGDKLITSLPSRDGDGKCVVDVMHSVQYIGDDALKRANRGLLFWALHAGCAGSDDGGGIYGFGACKSHEYRTSVEMLQWVKDNPHFSLVDVLYYTYVRFKGFAPTPDELASLAFQGSAQWSFSIDPSDADCSLFVFFRYGLSNDSFS